MSRGLRGFSVRIYLFLFALSLFHACVPAAESMVIVMAVIVKVSAADGCMDADGCCDEVPWELFPWRSSSAIFTISSFMNLHTTSSYSGTLHRILLRGSRVATGACTGSEVRGSLLMPPV